MSTRALSIAGRILGLPQSLGANGTALGWSDSKLANVRYPQTFWVMLIADYNLTNSTALQKAFNTTTNGALTLEAGVYEFDYFAYITGMSGTSGNITFNPVGAGTAVTNRWGQQSFGLDNNSPLASGARGGSASVTAASTTNIVTSATGTGMVVNTIGMFRVSTAGTIIPSLTLSQASAAVMKAGSWFRVRRVGLSTETYVGAWT